jgi:hypothetical protein
MGDAQKSGAIADDQAVSLNVGKMVADRSSVLWSKGTMVSRKKPLPYVVVYRKTKVLDIVHRLVSKGPAFSPHLAYILLP